MIGRPLIETLRQLTTTDVANMAGVTDQAIRRHRIRGTIPEPDGYVGRTPFWFLPTIEEWLANRRGRGRPRAQ